VNLLREDVDTYQSVGRRLLLPYFKIVVIELLIETVMKKIDLDNV